MKIQYKYRGRGKVQIIQPSGDKLIIGKYACKQKIKNLKSADYTSYDKYWSVREVYANALRYFPPKVKYPRRYIKHIGTG